MLFKIKRHSLSWKAKQLLFALGIGSCSMLQGTMALASENGDGSPNEITINSNNYSGGWVNGAAIETGDASGYTVKVSDIDVKDGFVNGAYVSGNGTAHADNNTVTVTNVDNISFLHGGFAERSEGTANNNVVNVHGGSIYHIHAGHIGTGEANNNTVNFYDGTVSTFTGAGFAVHGESSNNVLNIYNGTLNGTTQGGFVYGNGNAIGNQVNINGGTINGNVYGGYVGGSGEVRNNEINISGNPDLTNASLYAGYLGGNTDLYGSNNSLNFYTKDITASTIGGFDNLNYYLPSNISNGDTILTLTDKNGTNLTNTAVNVYSEGANFSVGDTFTLLRNDNGITVSNVTNSGKLAEGISMDYGLELSATNDPSMNSSSYALASDNINSSNPTRITATVGERLTDGLKPQTAALAQATLPTINLVHAGSDRILHWLPPEDLFSDDAMDLDLEIQEPTNEFKMFANMDFSSLRTKTGNGSHIKSKFGGIDLGWARSIENSSGTAKLTFAPVVDYGTGNYDSYLSDGLHGNGKTSYLALGMIARQTFKNGFYYEGSFRMGRANSDFKSSDFLMGDMPTTVSYDTSAPIWAAHIHLGKFYKISPRDVLQVYGHYFHTHQNGMNADLSTGEHYSFDAVNSGRFRTGFHLTHRINQRSLFYSGLAYQYEYTSDARGTYKGLSTPSSKIKGSSGMIELGYQIKPNKNTPWMIDAGLVGWIGHQKGVSFQVKLKKSF